MLNGRVYGRRRPYNKASTDPFANVRDTEPEFVEWGYGGMGSNKSNTNSSMGSAWRAVQNGTNSSSFGNDEDDATGMAWVKKRRAARESAKLEAEKTEPQLGGADIHNPQPETTESEAQGTPRLPKEDIPQPAPGASTVAPAEQPHEGPKHITTAISLPPQRAHKRDPSLGHRIQIPQVESPIKEKPPFGVDVFDMDLVTRPDVKLDIPEPSPDSATEDEEDEDSSIDEDDEDDSDVYSEDNAHSKTTLGAGVEKVSRHKDTPQSKPPNLPHAPPKNQISTSAIEA